MWSFASEIIDACKLTPLEELFSTVKPAIPAKPVISGGLSHRADGRRWRKSAVFSLFGSSDLTANQEQEQTQNTTVEQLKEADVHAAMKDADQASKEEIGIFIKTGKREQPAKDEVTSSQEDVLPDLTSVQNTYNGMVTFTEKNVPLPSGSTDAGNVAGQGKKSETKSRKDLLKTAAACPCADKTKGRSMRQAFINSL